MEERDLLCDCDLVEQVTGRVVVHGIHNTISFSYQIGSIGFIDLHIDGMYRDVRVYFP